MARESSSDEFVYKQVCGALGIPAVEYKDVPNGLREKMYQLYHSIIDYYTDGPTNPVKKAHNLLDSFVDAGNKESGLLTRIQQLGEANQYLKNKLEEERKLSMKHAETVTQLQAKITQLQEGEKFNLLDDNRGRVIHDTFEQALVQQVAGRAIVYQWGDQSKDRRGAFNAAYDVVTAPFRRREKELQQKMRGLLLLSTCVRCYAKAQRDYFEVEVETVGDLKAQVAAAEKKIEAWRAVEDALKWLDTQEVESKPAVAEVCDKKEQKDDLTILRNFVNRKPGVAVLVEPVDALCRVVLKMNEEK